MTDPGNKNNSQVSKSNGVSINNVMSARSKVMMGILNKERTLKK